MQKRDRYNITVKGGRKKPKKPPIRQGEPILKTVGIGVFRTFSRDLKSVYVQKAT